MTDTTLNQPSPGLAERIKALLNGKSENARSGRNAIFIFLIRVFSAALVYASQVLLARWMGAFEFGIFAYVWVWVIVLGSLTPLGFNTAILRFIPDLTEKKEFGFLRGVIVRSRMIVAGVGLAVTIAGTGIVFLLRDYLDNYYVLPLVFGLVCVPLYALAELNEGVARNYGWSDIAFLPVYILRPMLVLLAMGGITLMGNTPCGLSALLASILASFFVLVLQTIMLVRRLNTTIPQAAPQYRSKEWLMISLPILLVEGFYMLLAHIDTLMLQLFAPPEQVGIYFASAKTTGLIGFIYFAVTAVSAHKLAALHAKGEKQQFNALVKQIIHWIFWPSLAASLGIYLLGEPILWLYGPAFTAGYPVMLILLAGMLIRAATGPVEFMLNMTEHQVSTAWVLGITIGINLALNSMLIPAYGMLGAASGTVASIAFSSLMLYLLVRRKLGVNAFILGA